MTTDLSVIPPRESLTYTPRFSKQRLSEFRKQGDPLADQVCQALHKDHGGLVNIHDLLTTVEEKAELCGTDSVFSAFLSDCHRVPEWVDWEQIYRGQEIHAMLTPFMGLSLFAGSLVGGAQYATAAVVTALAGNITTDPTRRVKETSYVSLSVPWCCRLL